jgi:bifunctional ADP-heptose synthase (sugar kinase/adenylyltransferase)
MLDRYWFGDVERISPEAPVPVVHVSRTEERRVAPPNVARNAAKPGADVILLSVVGDDEHCAPCMQKLLEGQRVRTDVPDRPQLPDDRQAPCISRQQQLLRSISRPRRDEVLARSSPNTKPRCRGSTS